MYVDQRCEFNFERTTKQSKVKDYRPHAIAVGDLDKNGHLDFVVANSGSDHIGIFFGYGNELFSTNVIYSTGSGSRPYSVVVKDMNNDTHLDILVANHRTNSIGIFFGYGNRTFHDQMLISLGSSQPLSIAVEDLNNDHQLDIVVVNYGTFTVMILSGLNNGSFVNDQIYEMGYDSIPSSVAIGHFNADQYFDIAVVNSGTSELVILLSEQSQYFVMKKYSTGGNSNPCSIALANVNKDKNLDLIIANSGTNDVWIFIGDGNGSFTKLISYSIGVHSRPEYVAVSDFNNDNLMDFVVIDSRKNNIMVWKGYGNGNFSMMTNDSTGYESDPSSIGIGDVDNDHIPDVIITNNNTNNIRILRTYRVYPNANQRTYSMGSLFNPSCLTVGDFNNDNHLDVIVIDEINDQMNLFLGIGDGTFQSEQTFSLFFNTKSQYIAAGHFNNDKNLDLVLAMSGLNAIGIYFGDGNGSFTYGDFYFLGFKVKPICLAVADFNNDTNVDIVTFDSLTGNITVILRYNNGKFQYHSISSTTHTSSTSFIAADHLNNDKIMDFAVCNNPTGEISVYIGLGNGSFHQAIVTSLKSNYFLSSITLADLNKDNRVDIAFSNGGPSLVGVLYGYGNGTFGEITLLYTDQRSQAYRVNLGDVNNDNLLDIAVISYVVGNVSVFLGYGNQSFGREMTYSTGNGSFPNSFVFADFNEDKRIDIVVCNGATKNIGVFLFDDDAKFSNEITYQPFIAPHPYSVAIADLDKDNQSDLVVTNSGNNTIEILFHYNNGTFKNRIIYSTPDESRPQGVIITDLNNDHQLDIVISLFWKDNINVFLGFKNGTFDTVITYDTGFNSFPNSLVAAHLNQDNWMDIIVVNEGTNNVGIFFGYNYPSFIIQNIYLTGNAPVVGLVVVAHLNNDDRWDMAVVDQRSHRIKIFLGHGDGTLTEQSSYATGGSSALAAMVIEDFNNDKQMDVIFTDFATMSIGLFLGYGNGTFTNLITFSTLQGSPRSLATGDFNNDNQLDIVVTFTMTHEIAVFLGYGNGTFATNISYFMSTSAMTWSIAVDDFNGDNILDIAVTNYNAHNIGVLLGYGNGTFMEATMFWTGYDSYPHSIVTADFNNDNSIDIAVANAQNVGLFFGYGDGRFSSQITYSTGSQFSPDKITVADLNNDTISDIVLTESGRGKGTIGVFHGLTNGTFQILKIYSTGFNSDLSSIGFCDLNNDSLMDMVVSLSTNGSIGIMLQHKTEPFSTQTNFSTGINSRPVSVTVGDFNNDDYLDIVVVNSGTNNIGILFGNGNGYFSVPVTYSVEENSRPSSIASGDFNSDDYLDLVIVDSTNSIAHILLGNGNGTFQSLISYSTGTRSQPSSISVADLDQNNHLDIVITNWGVSNVLVFVGIGNGTFFEPKSYSLGYGVHPQSVAIGDMNNDNLLDIVVTTFDSDSVEILLQIC